MESKTPTSDISNEESGSAQPKASNMENGASQERNNEEDAPANASPSPIIAKEGADSTPPDQEQEGNVASSSLPEGEVVSSPTEPVQAEQLSTIEKETDKVMIKEEDSEAPAEEVATPKQIPVEKEGEPSSPSDNQAAASLSVEQDGEVESSTPEKVQSGTPEKAHMEESDSISSPPEQIPKEGEDEMNEAAPVERENQSSPGPDVEGKAKPNLTEPVIVTPTEKVKPVEGETESSPPEQAEIKVSPAEKIPRESDQAPIDGGVALSPTVDVSETFELSPEHAQPTEDANNVPLDHASHEVQSPMHRPASVVATASPNDACRSARDQCFHHPLVRLTHLNQTF